MELRIFVRGGTIFAVGDREGLIADAFRLGGKQNGAV